MGRVCRGAEDGRAGGNHRCRGRGEEDMTLLAFVATEVVTDARQPIVRTPSETLQTARPELQADRSEAVLSTIRVHKGARFAPRHR